VGLIFNGLGRLPFAARRICKKVFNNRRRSFESGQFARFLGFSSIGYPARYRFQIRHWQGKLLGLEKTSPAFGARIGVDQRKQNQKVKSKSQIRAKAKKEEP